MEGAEAKLAAPTTLRREEFELATTKVINNLLERVTILELERLGRLQTRIYSPHLSTTSTAEGSSTGNIIQDVEMEEVVQGLDYFGRIHIRILANLFL